MGPSKFVDSVIYLWFESIIYFTLCLMNYITRYLPVPTYLVFLQGLKLPSSGSVLRTATAWPGSVSRKILKSSFIPLSDHWSVAALDEEEKKKKTKLNEPVFKMDGGCVHCMDQLSIAPGQGSSTKTFERPATGCCWIPVKTCCLIPGLVTAEQGCNEPILFYSTFGTFSQK